MDLQKKLDIRESYIKYFEASHYSRQGYEYRYFPLSESLTGSFEIGIENGKKERTK